MLFTFMLLLLISTYQFTRETKFKTSFEFLWYLLTKHAKISENPEAWTATVITALLIRTYFRREKYGFSF